MACGWGEFLAVHGSEARHLAGIDVSDEKVTLARQRLADRIASGTAEVVQGDAAALPWDEGTFTAVTCMDSFVGGDSRLGNLASRLAVGSDDVRIVRAIKPR